MTFQISDRQWWLNNPIDRWRQDFQRRYPAAPVRAKLYHTHRLGAEAVGLVIEALEDLGIEASSTSHKAPYDLILADGRKVEVKAARWTRRTESKKYGRYLANLKHRQRNIADVVIFGCQRPRRWYWFIIPTRAISGRTLAITSQDPEAYSGRYREYLDAWRLVTPAQPELEVVS